MSVGEFAEFTLGPRDGGEGPAGIWRAQLGTRWHLQMQAQAALDFGTVRFEVPVTGRLPAGRWIVELAGRIDQWVDRSPNLTLVREIKTVSRPLPEGADVLRREYPGYFAQLAAYLALQPAPQPEGELVFVEISTGLSQSVPCGPEDQMLLQQQLARVQEFLELQWRARERLRQLQFRPAFENARPGQESIGLRLNEQAALGSALLLDAPTGFGKTGVLLEFALARLRSGESDRVVYLTGKATGQVQIMRTLHSMAPPMNKGGPAVWLVRPKHEHCVNREYHCVRDACRFLDGVGERWNSSGLARFYLLDDQPRDLASLRGAGLDACICPYEITRAALACNDVWIGDLNYVFSPGSRGLFYHQPGFDPERTLLIIDEAHNLPSRVADAYSHQFSGGDAAMAGALLASAHPLASLVRVWNQWTDLLNSLSECSCIQPDTREWASELIEQLGTEIKETGIDYGALNPRATETLWSVASLHEDLASNELERLWWCRKPGILSITCLDAAPVTGVRLREFGLVVFATATPGPAPDFAAAVGLNPEATGADPATTTTVPRKLGELTPRQTRSLALVSGADLLRRTEAPVRVVRAETPWREGAYDVAIDARVDTTFQHRSQHARTTALALESLVGPAGPAVGFFPSYAYAEMIAAELQALAPALRIALQPRSLDLAAQTAWVEKALADCGLLLLVLGTGFSEGIDLLGGRITRALVAGPALPEVNAVQRARLATWAPLGRDVAVRRTYQIPGMQKVNQALGRLVRAPGQHAKVLLHCRRFVETVYQELLVPAYRNSRTIETDEDFAAWLASPSPENS
jgi:Rad3-related DNA helicase